MVVNSLRFSSAYLLVAHGSRDPRFQLNLKRLAQLVQKQLENRLAISQHKNHNHKDGKKRKILATKSTLSSEIERCLVNTACLELSTVPLHDSIEQMARVTDRAGLQKLQILPLFLLPGVHVREDLPAQVEQAQQRLGSNPLLDLRPYLGSSPNLSQLLAGQFEALNAEARIIVAHGSRRPNANQTLERLASELKATIAYWSVSPHLAERVEELVKAGHQKIGIIPYFLFTGGITEAIQEQLRQLEIAFPKVELVLGQPLGATTELAEIIVDGVA